MRRLFQRQRKRPQGAPLIVVSGLPRSGTSMMMRMLEAGGVPVWTDAVRAADESNPRGYFELERVKGLEAGGDRTWVREGRGRALKVITHLLEHLPDDCAYRVILMRRNLDEVLASQNRMLELRGEENPVSDAVARERYLRHLADVKVFMRRAPNFELLEIRYEETVFAPARVAGDVARFLDGRADAQKMAAAVEPDLYRNRQLEGDSP